MNKLAGWSIAGILLAGGAAYGAFYAWDTGIIPGNPRAPTAEAMELVARRAANAHLAGRSAPCVGPDFDRAGPEAQGIPGIVNRPYPGQHSLVFLLQAAPRFQDVRDRQIKQLSYLAKQGFLAERETTLDTDAGPQQAREYRLTWKGYAETQRGGSYPCFTVGVREYAGIGEIQKLPGEAFGMELYQLSYDTTVRNIPAWATAAEANGLFSRLAEATKAAREQARVMRSKDGWITENEAQIRLQLAQNSGSDAATYVSETLRMATNPPVLDKNVASAAFSEFVASESWLGRGTIACLPLRLQRGGDERVAMQDQSAYTVAYFDNPSRRDFERNSMLVALQALSALEGAGLATREELRPKPPRKPRPGGAAKQAPPAPQLMGVRYTVSPQAVEALSLRSGSGCIPTGRMAVQFQRATQTPAIPRNAQIYAYATVSDTPEWVTKIAANLPALKSVLTDGLPLVGSMSLGDPGSGRGGPPPETPKWRVMALSPAYPEIAQAGVPAHLQSLFPETIAAAKTSARPGGGLPGVGPAPVAPPAAPVPRANAPRASDVRPPQRESVNTATLAYARRPPPYPAGAMEVHVVSVYEGSVPGAAQRGGGNHPEGIVEVTVGPTRSAMLLLLSSYEPIEWRVRLEPGARLERALAIGHHPQRVTIVGPRRVETITRGSDLYSALGKGRIPTEGSGNKALDAADTVEAITGKTPATLQARYRGEAPFFVNSATPRFSMPASKSVASYANAPKTTLKSTLSPPGAATLDTTLRYAGVGAFTDGWANRSYSAGKVYFEGRLLVEGGLRAQPHANVGVAEMTAGGAIDMESLVPIITHGEQKAYKDGDVFGIAMDLDAGRLYVRVNGAWVTGDPESGNGRALKKGHEYAAYFFASGGEGNRGAASWRANFGAAPFAHSVPQGYVAYDG